MKVHSIASVPQAVVDLVMSAEGQLVLISPYFDPWPQLARAIESATSVRRVETVICVRGGADAAKQVPKTEGFKAAGAEVHTLDRLHAKIYLSEKQAIVTSLNLLNTSALGSYEVAVSFDADNDADAYRGVVEAAEQIMKLAEDDAHLAAARAALSNGAEQPTKPVGFISRLIGNYSAELKTESAPSAPASKSKSKRAKPKTNSKASKRKTSKPKKRPKASTSYIDEGHCIRCQDDIKFNPDRPFCLGCYREWADEDDDEYEVFCHGCGDDEDTTFEKPLCRPCFRSN